MTTKLFIIYLEKKWIINRQVVLFTLYMMIFHYDITRQLVIDHLSGIDQYFE